MPGSTHSSGRVVIMDDVSWSEPTPRRRRVPDEAPLSLRRAPRPELDRGEDDALRSSRRPRSDSSLGGPRVVELEDEPTGFDDDERAWGPRPRLFADESGERRTVVITGHGADRYLTPHASRDRTPAYPRHGLYADRTAMWAVLLCVILLLVAITSH